MTCRACRNHLSDVPEPCGGQSGITSWACATTSETYQNHMPCRLAPPTAQTTITFRACRNHLSDVPETRAGDAGSTCQARWNHLLNSPEPPAGHAKITCQVYQNHLVDTPESSAGHARTNSQTHQNHMQDTPEAPAEHA